MASTGAFRAAAFTIANASGSAVTGWTGADAIAVQVWSGDDHAALTGTGLAASWTDAAAGIVSIVADGTHTLAPGAYQWRMMATHAGTTYEVCRGVYTISTAPGSTSDTPAVTVSPYTTIEDLRTLAPWVEQLQGKFDRTGFAEHQQAARAWFDDVLISAWRGAAGRNVTHSVGWLSDYGAPDYPPKWLVDVLATGSGVKITPRVKRACAAYAIYSICSAQSALDEQASVYRRHAIRFRAMAHNETISQVVYVKSSVTATDYTVAINLGILTRN